MNGIFIKNINVLHRQPAALKNKQPDLHSNKHLQSIKLDWFQLQSVFVKTDEPTAKNNVSETSSSKDIAVFCRRHASK